MRLPELGGMSGRLHVQQKIDAALAIATDRLGPVITDMSEAEPGEQPRQRLRIGPGKLDELEAVEAERVVADTHRKAILSGRAAGQGAPLSARFPARKSASFFLSTVSPIIVRGVRGTTWSRPIPPAC
jgi:hypothetical protein